MLIFLCICTTISLPLDLWIDITRTTSVQSFCGEHRSCFCTGISDEYGGRKSNECVLLSKIEHKFVVLIIYYTFNVDLMNFVYVYKWNYFIYGRSDSYVISIQRSYSRRSHKNKPYYVIILESDISWNNIATKSWQWSTSKCV